VSAPFTERCSIGRVMATEMVSITERFRVCYSEVYSLGIVVTRKGETIMTDGVFLMQGSASFRSSGFSKRKKHSRLNRKQ
jgi:hypothetical protein